MMERLREKKRNRKNLSEMLELAAQSPFLASMILCQGKKQEGIYTPSKKSAEDTIGGYKTTYGNVSVGLCVDGDRTAVNIEEQKLFKNTPDHWHILMSTSDCISTLALM